MDVSFTKNVDLWVFYANFRVERDTWWNFAKVTSAKMPLFSQFLDFGKKRDFTFTFQQVKKFSKALDISRDIWYIYNIVYIRYIQIPRVGFKEIVKGSAETY